MLKVCEIFMCQAFPWGSLYPAALKARESSCLQPMVSSSAPRPASAASCFCWWLPQRVTTNMAVGKKNGWYDWYVYIQMDRVDMSTWLLASEKTWISQLCPVWFFSALKTNMCFLMFAENKLSNFTWLENPLIFDMIFASKHGWEIPELNGECSIAMFDYRMVPILNITMFHVRLSGCKCCLTPAPKSSQWLGLMTWLVDDLKIYLSCPWFVEMYAYSICSNNAPISEFLLTSLDFPMISHGHVPPVPLWKSWTSSHQSPMTSKRQGCPSLRGPWMMLRSRYFCPLAWDLPWQIVIP